MKKKLFQITVVLWLMTAMLIMVSIWSGKEIQNDCSPQIKDLPLFYSLCLVTDGHGNIQKQIIDIMYEVDSLFLEEIAFLISLDCPFALSPHYSLSSSCFQPLKTAWIKRPSFFYWASQSTEPWLPLCLGRITQPAFTTTGGTFSITVVTGGN